MTKKRKKRRKKSEEEDENENDSAPESKDEESEEDDSPQPERHAHTRRPDPGLPIVEEYPEASRPRHESNLSSSSMDSYVSVKRPPRPFPNMFD